ncbi:hypothetical protein ABW19_dt0204757 [Dactylella cylindrospora]|nr:hypothetical protein ABW19_dt0204757 [Dactylella cylindrospora]
MVCMMVYGGELPVRLRRPWETRTPQWVFSIAEFRQFLEDQDVMWPLEEYLAITLEDFEEEDKLRALYEYRERETIRSEKFEFTLRRLAWWLLG